MKEFLQIIIALFFSFWLVAGFAQTTLTVTTGTPILDGVIDTGEWTSGTLTTQLGVTLRAMADGQFLYLGATWNDPTSSESIQKHQWSYDGNNWSQAEDEDRIAFIWDMGLNGGNGANCMTMCHPPLMHTNTGFVDVWHWKSVRTNPIGFVDDKYFDTNDRQSDPGTSAYSDNAPMGSGFPSFMAMNDPGANVDFLAIDANALANFDPFGTILPAHSVAEAVAFDSNATFASGSVIPGYRLRVPTGDRASVQSAGKYDSGIWTVEFKKPYAGGSFDFEVVPGSTVDFAHEIFDNEGGSATGHGTVDGTVYTLDFSMITSIEDPASEIKPTKFSLKQNYPNPFNPNTTIEFAMPRSGIVLLKIYSTLGEEVTTLVSEKLEPGKYKYDWDASSLASGVYLYRIQAGNYVDSKKMVLLR